MSTTKKPTEAEDEFFAREDAEKKRTIILAQTKALATAERERLKALHHMRCPKCGMALTELHLNGVEVDRCFTCHGIFLDEGDLKKITGEPGYWARMLHFFARKDYSNEGHET
jgi:Zn-finger nucleic acid-binding protein